MCNAGTLPARYLELLSRLDLAALGNFDTTVLTSKQNVPARHALRLPFAEGLFMLGLLCCSNKVGNGAGATPWGKLLEPFPSHLKLFSHFFTTFHSAFVQAVNNRACSKHCIIYSRHQHSILHCCTFHSCQFIVSKSSHQKRPSTWLTTNLLQSKTWRSQSPASRIGQETSANDSGGYSSSLPRSFS
ncbi:hypothetical protein ES702_00216 [subsurface metagenome]